MHFIKHILLFIKNNFMQLQRKWLSLPLLLIFPIVIVGLVLTIIIAFISPTENEAIEVGLVDLDQSTETESVVHLIDEASQFGTFIRIKKMSEDKANELIAKDQLSSYIVFPKGFTNNLYQGNSIELPIVGNPNQPTESYLTKELIESVVRHIRTSQANILTINYYANELAIDKETRNNLLFEQFKEYLFYTIGRDKIINENEITNNVTASPVHYYGTASWFIILTIWLLSIYNFLTKDDALLMKQRMKLYGVTRLQQIMARIFVTLLIATLFALALFYLLQKLLKLELDLEDSLRVATITFLYSFVFLQGLAIIEFIIISQKFRLLVQSLLTGLLLILSGAIIPTLYFPIWIQDFVIYSFSYEGFRWIQEILLNNRLYADYLPLLIMNLTGVFLLVGISLWKERIEV